MALGSTLVRRQLLQQAGYEVLPVPSRQWAALGPDPEEQMMWIFNLLLERDIRI